MITPEPNRMKSVNELMMSEDAADLRAGLLIRRDIAQRTICRPSMNIEGILKAWIELDAVEQALALEYEDRQWDEMIEASFATLVVLRNLFWAIQQEKRRRKP